MFVILFSACFYTFGHLIENGIIIKPNFFQSLYFSIITFTTVGFGDITPIGASKLVVMFESICGLFVIPLFIIGFARKYLRV